MRTVTPVRACVARTRAAGLSFRAAASTLGMLIIDRPHQAICKWKERLAVSRPPMSAPSQVTINDTAIQIGRRIAGFTPYSFSIQNSWWTTKSSAAAACSRGGHPASSTEKDNVSEAEFLVDGGAHLTALYRLRLRGQIEYRARNHRKVASIAANQN